AHERARDLGIQRRLRMRRYDAVTVAQDHRYRAAREVADVVGQLGGVPRVETLPGEFAVTVPGYVTHQVVAERIRAVALDRLVELHLNAFGLRQLAAADRHEAVGPDRTRQSEPGAHQHGRPVDRMEPRDVLADHVHVGRPQPLPVAVREAGG